MFVTAVFQREGLSHLIGRECGVERHIQIFKNLGIWNEKQGLYTKSQVISLPLTGTKTINKMMDLDHGIVEYVVGLIHTIEGNSVMLEP